MSETAPNALNVAPDAPKVAPDAPKDVSDAPKVAPDAPKDVSDAPKDVSDAPKDAPNADTKTITLTENDQLLSWPLMTLLAATVNLPKEEVGQKFGFDVKKAIKQPLSLAIGNMMIGYELSTKEVPLKSNLGEVIKGVDGVKNRETLLRKCSEYTKRMFVVYKLHQQLYSDEFVEIEVDYGGNPTDLRTPRMLPNTDIIMRNDGPKLVLMAGEPTRESFQ